MNTLLSTKGSNVTTWRAATDFVTAYRQKLFDRAASDPHVAGGSMFLDAYTGLEAAATAHRDIMLRLEKQIGEVAAATPSTNLNDLTLAFFSDLYDHFGHFRSAPAFYQLSMSFLCQVSETITKRVIGQLGLYARHLPEELALVAVGPAGRGEYSPYCPLHVLLVHCDATAAQRETINLFCHSIHEEFTNAGLELDTTVNPKNPLWRGTISEWQQRCADGSRSQTSEQLIDICRLADQYPLYPVEGAAQKLREASLPALRANRPARINLLSRMMSLSNGLNMMGRFKLERSGGVSGLFRLLDHGLLPLSAALSALALIKKSSAIGSCERIKDLLSRQEIDVEFAERILATWYDLNVLRLQRELSFPIAERSNLAAFLVPDDLTAEQRLALKNTLESVASIQRYVEITVSGLGE